MGDPRHRRDCTVPRDGNALDTRCSCGLRGAVLEAYDVAQADPESQDFQGVMVKTARASVGFVRLAYVGCVGIVVLVLVALLGVAMKAWGLL